MKKIANINKRFSLSEKSRTALGKLLLVLIGISLILDFSQMIQDGRFSINISLVFSLIYVILLLSSKEHSETVIIGVALYSLYVLVDSVVSVIRYHNYGYTFSYDSLISVLFSAFIIIALYRPMNTKIVKAVPILYFLYCAYLLVSGIIPFLSSLYSFTFIIRSCVSLALGVIIPLVFVCAKYEDAEKDAFMQIEYLISSAFTAVLGAVHVILFVCTEALLVGHEYGSPDKYGDYASGLYHSEVATLDSMIPLMWIIVAVLFVILLIHSKVNKFKTTSNTNRQAYSTANISSKFSVSQIIPVVSQKIPAILAICLIGTIFVAGHYSLFS